jgi:hypothetical protein
LHRCKRSKGAAAMASLHGEYNERSLHRPLPVVMVVSIALRYR